MTTSVSKTTPQNAPRDPQGLMKLGIFQLRILIEACGGLTDPNEKMAFAKMSVEDKVQLAMQLLAQWDRANGGGQMPMNGAGHASPAPMQMMQPQGMPLMQVDPAAVAAAAQAAAPPLVQRRTPRNTTAQEAPTPSTDLGSEVVNGVNRIITQNDEQSALFTSAMKDVLTQLSEANKTNADNTSNYKAVYGALGVINAQLQALQFQTKLAMALSLQLAEQVLQGATREQVLGAALGDVDTIAQILVQATTPGKG